MALLETLPEHLSPAPGVDLLFLPEPRLKRALLQLDWDRPLDERSPARTLLAQVLEQGTARHPSRMHLAQAQEEAFGSSVSIGGLRAAERHRLQLRASWVGERFLPPGESSALPTLGLARELLEEPRRGADSAPFPQEVVAREQAQLIRQIESLVDDRSSYAQQRFYEAMCAGEPFARAPWGSLDEVRALDAPALEQARTELLARATVLGVVVGPFDRAPILEALDAWLGAGAASQRERPPDPAPVDPGALRETHEALPVDQARFHLGFRVPRPQDSAEMETLLLANAVLGGGIHGRLFRIVREERSLAYGISSEVLAGKGLLTVSAGLDASRAEEVRDEVLRQVADLAASGPRDEELAMAKAAFLNGLQGIGDAAGSLARFYAREFQFGLHRSPAQRAAAVDAVTPQAIQEAAGRWQPDLVYLLAAGQAQLQEAVS